MSRSAARQYHSKKVKLNATKQFANSPRFLRLHNINLLTPSSRFCRNTQHLLREQAATLIQLRTNHIPLRKYLHRIGKSSSPMCWTCTSQRETTHHFLMMCPVYTAARRQLEESIGRAARSMKTLLMNPKVFPHLFQFISASCSFSHAHTNLQMLAPQEEPADWETHPEPTCKQSR